MFDNLHKLTLLLLVVTSILKGLVWCLIIPPLFGMDEPQHFMYARSIARSQCLRIEPNILVPSDVWDLTQREHFQGVRKRAETFSMYPIDADARHSFLLQPKDNNSYHVDNEQLVATEPNFYAYHPPLYYCLVAVIQSSLERFGILWELFACRLFSVGLGVCTIILAYATGRMIWKEKDSLEPIVLATLVSFQPMATFSFSTITNVALEITFVSALLLTCVRAIHLGLRPINALQIALIMSAGMLTKLSFIAAAPLVVLLSFWQFAQRIRFKSTVAAVISLSLLMVAPFTLVSLWWYESAWRTGGDSLAHMYPAIPYRATFDLMSYICNYRWFEIYSKVCASYWGSFAWRDAHASVPLIAVISFLLLLAAIVSGTRAARVLRSTTSFEEKAQSFSVLFLTCASALLVLFYAALDMRLNAVLGGYFTIRGQYYLPAIIGQMLWLVFAIACKNKHALSYPATLLICAGMIVLNFYDLFGVVVAHSYGPGSVSSLCAQAALLQPVVPMCIQILLAFFAIATCLLMFFLFRLFRKDTVAR
jgi:hypothetical protein